LASNISSKSKNNFCAICCSNINSDKKKGYLKVCTHYFCYDCIKIWADKENTCPLCKIRFNKIYYKDENQEEQFDVI
jgi:hypothetical protein